jgi:hypothetical protein
VTTAPDISALRMLRQARDRIDRDYAEPVRIDSLSAAAGYSTAHLHPCLPRRLRGDVPDPAAGRARLRVDSGNWFGFTQRKG